MGKEFFLGGYLEALLRLGTLELHYRFNSSYSKKEAVFGQF